MTVSYLTGSYLTLKAMDKDALTRDDPLGEVTVSLDALLASSSLPTQSVPMR